MRELVDDECESFAFSLKVQRFYSCLFERVLVRVCPLRDGGAVSRAGRVCGAARGVRESAGTAAERRAPVAEAAATRAAAARAARPRYPREPLRAPEDVDRLVCRTQSTLYTLLYSVRVNLHCSCTYSIVLYCTYCSSYCLCFLATATATGCGFLHIDR